MRKFLRKMAKAVKQATKPEEFTLPRKLATIERKDYVRGGDPIVACFEVALQRLAQAADVPETRAADISVHTHKLAAGKRTLLQVLTDLHDSIPSGGLGGVAFEELAAAYLILVISPE